MLLNFMVLLSRNSLETREIAKFDRNATIATACHIRVELKIIFDHFLLISFNVRLCDFIFNSVATV